MQVTEHRGLEGLKSLEADWRRLVGCLEDPEYHQDYDWFLSYTRHMFPDDRHLCFFAVSSTDGLVLAIFPLEWRRHRFRRLHLPVWGLIGSRPEDSDIQEFGHAADFLCEDPQLAPVVVDVLRRHLAHTRPAAGLLLFARFIENSNAWNSRIARSDRLHPGATAGGFEIFRTNRPHQELLESLSGHFRRNLRNRLKRLQALGPVSFSRLAPDEEGFSVAYENFLRVEASGWKGRESSAVRHLPIQKAFLEEVLFNSRTVCPEIHRLHVGDQTVAAQIWLRYGRGMVNQKMGYDEAFKQYSPGQLLLGEVLRLACEDPQITRVSLSTHRPWHYDWAPEFTCRHFRFHPIPTWRAVLPLLLLQVPNLGTLQRWVGDARRGWRRQSEDMRGRSPG